MWIMRYARGAAMALAAVGIAGAVAAAPAEGAASPGWRVTQVFPASSWVNGVAATGPRDAWAVAILAIPAGPTRSS